MDEQDAVEPTFSLSADFVSGDTIVSVDPGLPFCVAPPGALVSRGATVHWKSLSGEDFHIRFPGGAPCSGWGSDWKESRNGRLVCAIPRGAPPGGYKYDVRIGDCESDPIVWVD